MKEKLAKKKAEAAAAAGTEAPAAGGFGCYIDCQLRACCPELRSVLL